MAIEQEGKEIETGTAEWAAMSPEAGQILEVDTERTSASVGAPGWAAFFIVEVANESDGSFLISARFMGAEDKAVKKELSSKFVRGGRIHLCLSRPCIESRPLEALHVTKVRLWRWESFKETDYLNRNIAHTVQRWQDELAGRAKEPRRKDPPALKEGEGVKPMKKRGERPKKDHGGPPVGSGITPEMKEKLRSKLGDIRRKVRHTAGEPGLDGSEPEEGLPVVASSEASSCDYVPTSPEEHPGLKTGTAMVPTATGVLATAGAPPGKSKKKKDDHGAKVTKGATTKSLSGQLIARALAATEKRREQRRKRKKKSKSSGSSALVSLLGKILTKEKSEKDKKSKKKKEKKKKRRTLRDGVIVSCSSTSTELSSFDEKTSDSDSDLEAPMKRKSRDHPGSVLSMLTEHIRDVMEQASLTDLPLELQQVTGGVKVASYFALHVKPHFPGYARELREMFTLAATLDLLRSGDVARVGDSLAARFMAIHQAMLDQGWTTARHMELHNMDEPSSATASIVLASRKHSRLVEKVQGKGWNNWNQWGARGKGKAKGDWSAHGDAKGEKGKGKKGKFKTKQKDAGWERKVQDWDKSKDKNEEKGS